MVGQTVLPVDAFTLLTAAYIKFCYKYSRILLSKTLTWQNLQKFYTESCQQISTNKTVTH